MQKLILIILAVLALSACGLKGDLYLEDQGQDATAAESPQPEHDGSTTTEDDSDGSRS